MTMAATFPHVGRYSAGERVALFLPCYCDVLFPHVGEAVVSLFARLGIPLDYPMDQTCCGQPAFNTGHWDEARGLADRFARVFADWPWIVVPSGSCGAMARAFYPSLKLNSADAAVSKRVFDLATFIVSVLGRTDVGARFESRVTYHDGCHGRRELGVGTGAIALLRKVRGLTYVELPRIDECCGFGGTFSVKYPELSVSMGESKLQAIVQTDAEVVTSGDSSCLMHIEGLLRKSEPGSTLRFMHLAEILAAG